MTEAAYGLVAEQGKRFAGSKVDETLAGVRGDKFDDPLMPGRTRPL